MNDIALKSLLVEWAKAYGGTQFRRHGYVNREALVPQLAPGCQTGSTAERIERIVQRMDACGPERECSVLRVEYFMTSIPEGERLQQLRRGGLPVGRSAYCAYLSRAHAFILGALVHLETAREAA